MWAADRQWAGPSGSHVNRPAALSVLGHEPTKLHGVPTTTRKAYLPVALMGAGIYRLATGWTTEGSVFESR
jgi:hypothetical protein